MFYTLTLNPSIDNLIKLPFDLKEGVVNRSIKQKNFIGGKGINASIIIARLGCENSAICFLGENAINIFKSKLKKENVSLINIPIKGDTRINTKIKYSKETEINGEGPNVSEKEYEDLLNKINNLTSTDSLMIMGSSVPSLGNRPYIDIVKICNSKNIIWSIDIASPIILDLLKYQPFVIKPNKNELEEFFKKKLNSIEEIIQSGLKLQSLGAKNVLITLGSEGSILISSDGSIYKTEKLKIDLNSSVGAGDSTISTFFYKKLSGSSDIEALKMANAAGSATASVEWLGTKEKIENYYKKIKVVKLDANY